MSLPLAPVFAGSEPDIVASLSVVSHGQGLLVANLLDDLAAMPWHDGVPFEVIVTINIPEDEQWLPRAPLFPLVVLRNTHAKGFGANHNAAFTAARGRYFAVVNPDIRLATFSLRPLIAALDAADAGLCGPVVLAPDGGVEDSARRFPSIMRLLRRRLAIGARRKHGPDYPLSAAVQRVDWLGGMFLLFRSAVFREIEGFDERFFMYLEDVEISRHLTARGKQALWVGSTAVVHDASRASRRSLRHLRYHLASVLRYFLLPPRR